MATADFDARKLSPEQQETLRITAIRMRYDEGYTQRAIAAALGVTRPEVVRWCRKYEKGGLDALRARKRGRRSEDQQALAGWQCATVLKLIAENMPDQMKMPFVLWTRAAVRDLIAERFGVTLALTTMGNYLRRWGFTPQKPVRKAYQQRGGAVEKWMEEDYPKIAAKAKKDGAKIYWCDETKVTNEVHNGRSYAPKGKTPVVRESAKRLKINLISAVTNKGELSFMTYPASMTQNKYLLFLARLVRSAGGGKVYVIADNLRVHHGKKVKAWAAAREGEIELYYIPSYSPELNPDEYLNRDLKKNVHGRRAPRSQAELKENVKVFMRMLQRCWWRVAKYFNSSKLEYCRAPEKVSAV
jgi:transposase